jgi:hypothetical protein
MRALRLAGALIGVLVVGVMLRHPCHAFGVKSPTEAGLARSALRISIFDSADAVMHRGRPERRGVAHGFINPSNRCAGLNRPKLATTARHRIRWDRVGLQNVATLQFAARTNDQPFQSDNIRFCDPNVNIVDVSNETPLVVAIGHVLDSADSDFRTMSGEKLKSRDLFLLLAYVSLPAREEHLFLGEYRCFPHFDGLVLGNLVHTSRGDLESGGRSIESHRVDGENAVKENEKPIGRVIKKGIVPLAFLGSALVLFIGAWMSDRFALGAIPVFGFGWLFAIVWWGLL